MKINPLTAIDFYKADHRRQYPDNTGLVYANFTPRSDERAHDLAKGGVVVFGIQAFVQDFLIDCWNDGFFNRPKGEVLAEYSQRMYTSLGPDAITVEHIGALHDLGYLPLSIKALPEGTYSPIKIPVLTIVNTHPDFFWLTNYLESVISTELWKPMTAATTAYAYYNILSHWAEITGADPDFVQLQAHDFSFRGMSGMQDAAICGIGHLLSFIGTDSVLAIDAAERFYGADCMRETIGVSVPATEHSVMCMGGMEDEIGTFDRLITEVYPSGIVSVVSDTWDFWKVMTEYLPALKDKIMARDGKLVIRPDSGDPVDIICGDVRANPGSPAYKGAVQILWEVFGGTTTSNGYKVLDPHIGLIYGDSITLDRANLIMSRLATDGFASSNVVLGVGSYTYQHVTRDTYGFAMKATYGEVNGIGREIFKDPKTDGGTKKSARGLLHVTRNMDLIDRVGWEDERCGALQSVFLNGKAENVQTLQEIRALVRRHR